MRATASLTLLLLACSAVAASPQDAVAAALADAKSLPPDAAARVRYLSAYAVPEAQRSDLVKVLAFHINSLSREAELIPPTQITPDLVRIDLRDYGIEAKTWDRLAEVDPYFHLSVEEIEEYGNWYVGGQTVNKGTPGAVWKTTRTVKGKKVSAAAPWLDPRDAVALVTLTHSTCPIVRSDWFIVQTGIARTDSVSYYDFLGLGKKEADFERLIGADPEASRRVRREIAAVLGRSGVALNNRRVVRLQSLTGGYWLTDDFKTSTGKQNVLRFLDGDTDPPAGDASERYGVLPNGLFAYWLQDSKGTRQDVVPPDIALDGHTTSNDRNIHGGIKSCCACHVEGIRPVADYARRTYQGAIRLQSNDYDKYVRLRQLYLSDLDGQVKRDQDDFARVVLKVNGLTVARNSKVYEQAFDRYNEADLSLADAAREVGCTPQHLLASLKAYALTEQARKGAFDPVLASLLADPVVPVRRQHFEESFALMNTIVRGYVVP